MNKFVIAGAFAVGAATGAIGVSASKAQTPAPIVEPVNMKLVRGETLDDGGVVWTGRVCGYEMEADGGHTKEPCWPVKLDAKALPLQVLLDQK